MREVRSEGKLCPVDRAQVASCALAHWVRGCPVSAVGLKREKESVVERLRTLFGSDPIRDSAAGSVGASRASSAHPASTASKGRVVLTRI